MQASEIRESYKLMGIPGMISMASGSPDSDLFPVEDIIESIMSTFKYHASEALQYATTEGYLPLREKLVEKMKQTAKVECTTDNIILVSGSQQGLELSAKIFVNEGDYIACESPSYMGAFNAFCPYLPEYESIPTDDIGIIPEELDKVLARNEKVSMIYVIPNFQNPTGHTWSLERRRAFMDVIQKYNVPVIEDDPYGEIRYEGESLPSLKSMDTKGQIVYLGSFSKIMAPGFRVGWICAEPEIIEKFVFAKQGCDMQVTAFAPIILSEYMEAHDLNKHVKKICDSNKRKRDLMLNQMEENFPDTVKWFKPEGGLFIWVTLPEGINSKYVLDRCVENNVIFVTGKLFYPMNGPENTFRLNFSKMSEENIVEGIKRLGAILKDIVNNREIL